MTDIFNGAKFLPTLNDLKKLARSRGIPNKKFKDMKSEELSTFLNVPLICNPNYVECEKRELQRPSNEKLRFLADNDVNHCGGCFYKACNKTVITDTSSGERFEFHTMKQAYLALGTRSRKSIDAWKLEVVSARNRQVWVFK